MKRILLVIALCAVIPGACTPSAEAVNTAIAQTQAANPTATFTPVPPTETLTPSPTPIPTITDLPSATPDLRLIDIDPRKILLQKDDLPPKARYFLPGPGWTSPVTNSEIVSSWTVEEGQAYLAETGRIDGWLVVYKRGTNNAIMPEEVLDNAVIYATSEGAQIVVTKYDKRNVIEAGFKEIDAPQIGDVSRAYHWSETNSSGQTRVSLHLSFSYRNVYHTVRLWGWDHEVSMEFAVDIADQLLEGLKELPLSDTVEFRP